MRTEKILEMLKKGQLDQIQTILEDELYQDSLKINPSAKKRYTAMKKYFSYTDSAREVLCKPCVIEFESKQYTSFTNSWSLVLTTEDTGEIELFNTENGNYPDVGRLVRFDGIKKKIDINKVIAEAKSKGYKLNKKEVGAGFKYLMMYDDTYYKIGLLDMSYRIIDNGEVALTYHPYGEKMPLTIQTDIGLCMLMPVYMHDGEPSEEHVIVEVK